MMTEALPSTTAEAPARKALALLIAAAAAPPLLLIFLLTLGSATKGAWGTPGHLLISLPFVFAFGVGFGLPGSATLLALAFACADAAAKRLRGPRRYLFVVAGVAAGAAHVALAYLSGDGPWAKGLGLWLGTWFAATMLKTRAMEVCLSALVAGAAAGAIYAFVRFPAKKESKEPS